MKCWNSPGLWRQDAKQAMERAFGINGFTKDGASWAIFCISPPSIGHQIWPMLLLLVSFPSFAFARCGFFSNQQDSFNAVLGSLRRDQLLSLAPLQMGLFENWGGPQICLRRKMRMIPPKNCRGFTNIFRPTYTQLVQFAQFFQSLVFLASNYKMLQDTMLLKTYNLPSDIAIEHVPFIADWPIKDGDFP